MKKTFDFSLADEDEIGDLDGALDSQLEKKISLGATNSASKKKVSIIETVTEEALPVPKPEVKQLTSAQIAAQQIKDHNAMELKVGPMAAGESEDCEVYGGEHPDVDIDQQNQQNLFFSQQSMMTKSSSSAANANNQAKEIVTDPINFQSSIAKFSQVSEQEIEHRNAVKKSRQAVIAGRLLRIKGEMKMLESQLRQNDEQQSQSASGTDDITNLELLKGKLENVCRMQGFQDILLKRDDLARAFDRQKPVTDEELKAATEKLDVKSLVTQLHLRQNKAPETDSAEETTVDLIFDRSKKEMGTLMKLNSLQKRIHFIKHVLGDWKPNPRAKTLTDQIVQVQKLLDLLDAQKISAYQKNLDTLLQELDDLQGKNASMSVDARKEKLGHPKELVEKLHTACSNVKQTLENIPKLVERMEQRRKMHEMCAQVILDTTQLEKQQDLLVARFRENKDLLGEVKDGMTDNLLLAKQNIEYLKTGKQPASSSQAAAAPAQSAPENATSDQSDAAKKAAGSQAPPQTPPPKRAAPPVQQLQQQ